MELTQFELGILFERLGLGKEEIKLVLESRGNIEHVLEVLLEKHRIYTGTAKEQPEIKDEELEEEDSVEQELVEYVPSREVRELQDIASNTEDPNIKEKMQETIEAAKERELSELNKVTDVVEASPEVNDTEDMDKTMDERLDALLGMTKPVSNKGSENNMRQEVHSLDGWVLTGSDKKLDPVSSEDEVKPSETIDTTTSAEDIFGKWDDASDSLKAPAPVAGKGVTNTAPNVVKDDVFFSNPWEVRK